MASRRKNKKQPLFKASFGNVSIFKKIIDIITKLVTDVNFECTSKGFGLQSMDSSHVSLISLFLKSSSFEEYYCNRSTLIGVNLEALGKILKFSESKDKCTLEVPESGDTLILLFESQTKEMDSKFEIKLLNIDSEKMGIPKQDQDVKILLCSSKFQKICSGFHAIGADSINISVESKNTLSFSVEGDSGSGCINIHRLSKPKKANKVIKNNNNNNNNNNIDDDDFSDDSSDSDSDENESQIIDIDFNKKVNLGFALKYLLYFSTASVLSETLLFGMSEGTPLIIKYPIDECGHLKFYLAPKIDNDD